MAGQYRADIGVMAVIVRNQARSGGRRSVEFENSMARLQGVFNRTDPFDCRLMGGIKVMTGQWARFLNEGQKQERIARKDDYCYPEPKYPSLDTSHVPVVFPS